MHIYIYTSVMVLFKYHFAQVIIIVVIFFVVVLTFCFLQHRANSCLQHQLPLLVYIVFVRISLCFKCHRYNLLCKMSYRFDLTYRLIAVINVRSLKFLQTQDWHVSQQGKLE